MLANVSIRTRFIFILIIMLLLNGFAYFSIFKDVYEEELRTQARVVVNNVESFSAWVSGNGGVWVTNDRSYLGHRSLLDASSKEPVEMYSKNPALATREYSEQIAKSDSPAKFRMTSENYMNPKNKPDKFEALAIAEISSQSADSKPEFFQMINGKYRYAKPVYHKVGCIRCHGNKQNAPQAVLDFPNLHNGFGYKVGDLAGVISVELQTESFVKRLFNVLLDSLVEMALIAFSFCLVLWFVWDRILRPINRLASVADAVSKGQAAPIDTSKMSDSTNNEVFKLTLSLSRLKNSYEYSVGKLSEVKARIEQAKRKKQQGDNR